MQGLILLAAIFGFGTPSSMAFDRIQAAQESSNHDHVLKYFAGMVCICCTQQFGHWPGDPLPSIADLALRPRLHCCPVLHRCTQQRGRQHGTTAVAGPMLASSAASLLLASFSSQEHAQYAAW